MTHETTNEPVRRITIAFDGALKGNPGPGGYAAILVNDDTGREKTVKVREALTTNNKMELSAALAGLNTLRPGAIVTMIGDSQYVRKGITEWLPGWKTKRWKTLAGKPVLDVELWRALELAIQQHQSVAWT